MHEPLLATAALPAQTRVLGVPLRPYSLGHELFLIREHSPFIFGGTVMPGDVFEAVWICSSTFDECRTAHERFSFIPKLWLMKRRAKQFDREASVEAFRQYRQDGSLEFPISEVATPSDRPSPRPPGAPFILRLHQFIMSHLRKSESEAWDYPVGLAKMRWATHWEQEGGLTIYNWHDSEFDRFVAEQEAKGAKQCRA